MALIVACCLGALVVHAPSPVAAQADGASDSDARAFFDQGRAAYDAGQFDEAAKAFRRAYVLSSRYALLYNIGQAELRAGRDALALEAFEGYLRQAPADDANRSEVEERARVLRTMGVQAASSEGVSNNGSPAPETTPTEAVATPNTIPVSSDNNDGPGIAPWIVVGGGGAAVIGGVVMMVVGSSQASEVTGASDGTQWKDIEGSAGSANTFWGIGLGLTGLGVAAAAVGLVWALSDSSSDHAVASATRLRFGATSLTLEGSF